MPDVSPVNYLSGFELLAANTPTPAPGIFIPLTAFPSLTAEEVDPYNGDVRKLMYEINRRIFTALSNSDPANRPTKFNITRATPTGINATTIRQTYTTSFDLNISDVDVASE